MIIFDRIIELLEAQVCIYRSLTHDPVTTSAQAALVRGTTPDQGAKALVCRADSQNIMIVLPGPRKLDTKTFKALFHFKDVRFVTPDELIQLTGLPVGAVPPFGHLFNLPVYLDTSLSSQTQIAFNAGDLSHSIIMDYSDYIKIASPILGNFSL